jgi:hypothetical protein
VEEFSSGRKSASWDYGTEVRLSGCEVVRVKGVGFFGYFFETKDFAN